MPHPFRQDGVPGRGGGERQDMPAGPDGGSLGRERGELRAGQVEFLTGGQQVPVVRVAAGDRPEQVPAEVVLDDQGGDGALAAFRAVRGPGGRVVGGVGSPGGADGGLQGGAVRGSHRAEPRGWPPPGWWTGGGPDEPLGKQATPEKGAGGRASRGTPGRPSVRRGRQDLVTVSSTGQHMIRRER